LRASRLDSMSLRRLLMSLMLISLMVVFLVGLVVP
jgi:hypothetical protein